MGQVTWRPEAVGDVEGIETHIAEEASPDVARKLTRDLYEATVRLTDYPLSGRIVPESDDERIREVIVGNYRVIHRIWSDDVEVIAVIHGARILHPKDLPA